MMTLTVIKMLIVKSIIEKTAIETREVVRDTEDARDHVTGSIADPGPKIVQETEGPDLDPETEGSGIGGAIGTEIAIETVIVSEIVTEIGIVIGIVMAVGIERQKVMTKQEMFPRIIQSW